MTRYAPNSDVLTGGQWVVKPGGLRVWEPDQPYRERTQDDQAVRMVLGILTAIAAGPAFCACGCWLINAHETCPACSVGEQTEVA
jgi:hypothetical protein